MRFCNSEPEFFGEVESTQDVVANFVAEGMVDAAPAMAGRQSAGRGRLGRTWVDEPGQSLLVSIALWEYADHPMPWLVGFGVSMAAAGALQTQLRWPNDLTVHGKKVGGVLTELVEDPRGRKIPVVGIGVNLNQSEFPEEIAGSATSLRLARGHEWEPTKAWHALQAALRTVPEPDGWECLRELWEVFDDTPGKRYRLPDGREAVALGVGPEGRLIASVDGETVGVTAADALFPR